jgi:hypothetical protein
VTHSGNNGLVAYIKGEEDRRMKKGRIRRRRRIVFCDILVDLQDVQRKNFE